MITYDGKYTNIRKKQNPYLSLEIIIDNIKIRLPGKNGREETYMHLCFLFM